MLRGVIFFLRARRLVGNGCLAYLAYVHNTSVDTPFLESVLLVGEFFSVSPINLCCLPPDWYIDFDIDIEVGTQSVSIPHIGWLQLS